jgi:hypothetical protein
MDATSESRRPTNVTSTLHLTDDFEIVRSVFDVTTKKYRRTRSGGHRQMPVGFGLRVGRVLGDDHNMRKLIKQIKSVSKSGNRFGLVSWSRRCERPRNRSRKFQFSIGLPRADMLMELTRKAAFGIRGRLTDRAAA